MIWPQQDGSAEKAGRDVTIQTDGIRIMSPIFAATGVCILRIIRDHARSPHHQDKIALQYRVFSGVIGSHSAASVRCPAIRSNSGRSVTGRSRPLSRPASTDSLIAPIMLQTSHVLQVRSALAALVT